MSGLEPSECVYVGDALGHYHFGAVHPFGPQRLGAFVNRFHTLGLDKRVHVCSPVTATDQQIMRFHTRDYVERVKRLSMIGEGYLDYGDTPAVPGIYEAAASVVGTSLDATGKIMSGECSRAFSPIAGLHHARRNSAAGFCVFNDCGVVIETLLNEYRLQCIAYVDIDAHHGDGVFYAYEDEPRVFIADIHEDGRYLYPGTGTAGERGRDKAAGTKLNVPMPPGAGDEAFLDAWSEVEKFINAAAPEFIVMQCGADSLAGDPITHLQYSPAVHGHAASRLALLADKHSGGRLLALGGGGYNLENLAVAWTAVVTALITV